MSASKLHLYWAAVLVCAGPLWAAPVSTGGQVALSDLRPVSAPASGAVRWSRRPAAARSWHDRTPTDYTYRVRQDATGQQRGVEAPGMGRTALVSQRDGGHSGLRESSAVGDEAGSETRSRAKAVVAGVRVAQDKWRDGYDALKSQQRERDHDRTRGAPRRPEKPAELRSSPKLSYIRRRRPLGAGSTADVPGLRATRGTVRPAVPPSQPVLTSIPRPVATSVAMRPASPPTFHPTSEAGGKPLSTRKPTEPAVWKNWQSPPYKDRPKVINASGLVPGSVINSKDRTKVINAAGLVPGSVINRRVSAGLSVPYDNRPANGVKTTTRPQHAATEIQESGDVFNANIFRKKNPHATKSPVLTPEATGAPTSTSGPAPSVEVLNLYEVGVLPNISDFFQHRQSGHLAQKIHGLPDGRIHGVSTSSGGGGKDISQVTFPLYVLPALPGAPPPPDWPTVRPGPARPCCKGRPGLVTPVDPPDRPVYPSIGSGYKPPPAPPHTSTNRPISRPSSSYGPPNRPSGPTGRPCGTSHCLYPLPPPPVPTPSLPPAPPPTTSVTSLGSVGSDLVCVYLRANGSALVLRADLTSGRYNISDDGNHQLSSPGRLGSGGPQLRDRPNSRPRYHVVFVDNQTTTVQQLLTRMRDRSARWEETHQPKTSIVCIVQRPEAPPGNETSVETPGGTPFKPAEPTEPPKPSEEPAVPTTGTTSTSTPTTTTTPKPTVTGAVDSLSATIASAVDTLGATAEAQLAQTMTAADVTAVAIGSNMKNYIGTSIPSIALATTVGIPVFVAILALFGAPPLLLSAMSVSSPLLLQGIAAVYNSLPN